METLLDIVAGLGLAGSVALVAWGLVLCIQHGFGSDATAGAQRAVLGDGALGEHWARVALGA